MGSTLKSIVLLFSAFFTLYSADIQFNINYVGDNAPLSTETIQAQVTDALNLEQTKVPYYKANVNVYADQNGAENFLVVYLLRSDVYEFVCYRLEVEGTKVVDVVGDYVEEDPSDPKVCGTCPDPDVEAVFSCITDFTSAVQGCDNAYNTATNAGLKAVKLQGKTSETMTNITNYLTCPKLKIWGRIGHGSTSGIALADGKTFNTTQITNNKTYMKGKTFIFNSCQCHNSPFEPAMISAGVYFYSGGDINLAVGPSEKVFARFMEKVIPQKLEMKKSMEDAMTEIKYKGFGISGDNSGPPWYFGSGALSLSVGFPVGGEEWEQGNSYTITWFSGVDGDFKIELLKGGVVNKLLAANATNGQLPVNITKEFTPGTDYKIRITSNKIDTIVSTSRNNFSIIEEYLIAAFPHIQNFDAMDTGSTKGLEEKWEQVGTDDIDWLVFTGPTPSRTGSSPDQTGPKADHTTGLRGNYVYVEASNPNNPTKKATIESPKFNLNACNNPQLSFWAHMFSATDEMGDLYLDIDVDGTIRQSVQHLTGDHGDAWFEVTQDLNQFKGEKVRFIFRAETGASWCSDICMDDFKITGNATGTVSTVTSPQQYTLQFDGSRLYYQVPENGSKQLHVALYTLLGKQVRTLAQGQHTGGRYAISLHENTSLPAGLYVCRLTSDAYSQNIPILLQK